MRNIIIKRGKQMNMLLIMLLAFCVSYGLGVWVMLIEINKKD